MKLAFSYVGLSYNDKSVQSSVGPERSLFDDGTYENQKDERRSYPTYNEVYRRE